MEYVRIQINSTHINLPSRVIVMVHLIMYTLSRHYQRPWNICNATSNLGSSGYGQSKGRNKGVDGA